MPANRNPVSAVSKDGLELIDVLKDELRLLKKELYGPDCNTYNENRRSEIEKSPKGISTGDLEKRLDEIFSLVDVHFAKESAETRAMIEDGLGRQVEKLMHIWFQPNALVMYSLRAEGRNRKRMINTYSNGNQHWGYTKAQTPIAVLPAKEWPSAWRDFLVFDRIANSKDGKTYMPADADYLLSTVHKFEVVIQNEKGKEIPQRKNLLNEPQYRRADDAESIHWRVKSGPEKLWKMVSLMTGLESKTGKTIEEIVDDAGIRLLCSDAQFGRKFGDVCSEFHSGYSLPDLNGAVILQKLPVEEVGYDHRKEFLASVPKKYRGFCKNIMTEEAREVKISNKSILPYYIEILSRFGRNNANVFDRNVINTLMYANSTFNAMYEEDGYDQFAYKARNEDWRTDNYTLFEWLVAKKLAPILTSGNSLSYVNDIIDVRTKQLNLKLS